MISITAVVNSTRISMAVSRFFCMLGNSLQGKSEKGNETPCMPLEFSKQFRRGVQRLFFFGEAKPQHAMVYLILVKG